MENTDARVSFEQNVFSYKKRLHHRVFLWNLQIFSEMLLYKIPGKGCFW